MAQIKVKKGDTLYALAKKYLGDGNRWKELGYEGDPTKLQIGTTLSIPTAKKPTKKPVPKPIAKPIKKPVSPVPAPTPAPTEPTGPGTIGPVFPIPSSPQLPGQPPPTGKPRPFPIKPTTPPGQIDYTKIPGWDKLTPQEQELLKVMVDGLKSPIDVGSIPTFNFDEALAQQASEAQYKPFFQEKLSDVYFQTQEARTRAEQDYAKRLGMSTEELQNALQDIGLGEERLGTEQQRFEADIAERQKFGEKSLAESAAERGLTFSGIRQKEQQQFGEDIAKQRARSQEDIAKGFEQLATGRTRSQTGFGQQQDLLSQARQRTLEDQARTEALAQRDITRQQQEAITGGVLQRRGEALQPYWYYFQKLAGGQ